MWLHNYALPFPVEWCQVRLAGTPLRQEVIDSTVGLLTTMERERDRGNNIELGMMAEMSVSKLRDRHSKFSVGFRWHNRDRGLKRSPYALWWAPVLCPGLVAELTLNPSF
jgi:hypothetical protein